MPLSFRSEDRLRYSSFPGSRSLEKSGIGAGRPAEAVTTPSVPRKRRWRGLPSGLGAVWSVTRRLAPARRSLPAGPHLYWGGGRNLDLQALLLLWGPSPRAAGSQPGQGILPRRRAGEPARAPQSLRGAGPGWSLQLRVAGCPGLPGLPGPPGLPGMARASRRGVSPPPLGSEDVGRLGSNY